MNIPRRIILALIALAICAPGSMYVTRTPEPVYEGRRLGEWLDVLDSGPFPVTAGTADATGKNFERAYRAIHEMGEKAVPHLLKLMEAQDSKLKLSIIGLAQKQSVISIKFLPENERHGRAVGGFTALGPKGKSAVPRLIQIVENPNRNGAPAAAALGLIGPEAKDAIPALVQVLKRPDPYCRIWAASTLGYIGKGDARGLTALIAALNDSNWVVRYNVLRAILTMGGDPQLIVPALIKQIDDSAPDVRREAAGWLDSFGTNAVIAAPRMRKLLRDDDPAMRVLAERYFQIMRPGLQTQ